MKTEKKKMKHAAVSSGSLAHDRIQNLLLSERIKTSPQMLQMLRYDLIKTLNKYITINENEVHLYLSDEPMKIHLEASITQNTRR